MKTLTIITNACLSTSIFTIMIVSTVANAESTPQKKAISPAKMTCEEFIALDEVVKPKVIYWADGFNRKSKTENEVVDFEETDRLIPVLVRECVKKPKELFWKVIKMKPLLPFA